MISQLRCNRPLPYANFLAVFCDLRLGMACSCHCSTHGLETFEELLAAGVVPEVQTSAVN